MHNAVRVLLLFLAVMTGWAADPPPPLVRSVLTTNRPAFGENGQALMRSSSSPYLSWSDVILANSGTGTNTTIKGLLTVDTNLVLETPRWVDSPVQLFWASTGPTHPSAVAVTNGSEILGMGFSTGGIGTEKVYGAFQFNHNISPSNIAVATYYIEPHGHVSPTVAVGAGSSNICFKITFDIQNINGQQYGPITLSNQIGLTTMKWNNLMDFGHVTNFFPSISAIMRCTVLRMAATSNEYNGTVILDGLDVHYPVDRFGSTTDSSP